MTVVNPKSISGINSITTGSGSDDILTIHTNNGTERLRIDSTGTTKIVTGIVTTLTATTGIVTTLTANTTTHRDDVTFTGASYNMIWDKSDNSLEFADNVKAKFGSGDDTHLYHNGSHTYISHRGTGDLILEPKEGENGVVLKTDGAVELYHDNSKKFETESSGCKIDGSLELTANLVMSDNDKIRLGNSQDLEIYHDSNHSYIKEAGTGSLIIDSDSQVLLTTPTFTVNNAANNETMITAAADGSVKLYHDHGQRLETFDLGIDIGTSATANFGIRWGGANYNYCNIWSEHGSGDIFIAGGLKPSSGSAGFVSSYGDNFSRNAIQVNAFGNNGIQFYASAAQNVAKDSAITVNEIARINQHGLTFGGESSSEHALDDYEEGSYTPVVYYDSVNNHTYSEQVGLYTKIGNFVYGTINLTWDEQASSGQVGFSLPFTSSNVTGTRTSGYFIYQDGLNIPSGQGSTHLILYGGQNSSSIYAYFVGGTNNCELGTSATQLTNTHTSVSNTVRIVFHYRTA